MQLHSPLFKSLAYDDVNIDGNRIKIPIRIKLKYELKGLFRIKKVPAIVYIISLLNFELNFC